MNKSTIAAMLLKEYSYQRATDVYSPYNYLAERGYEVKCKLGCGSLGAVLLCRKI